MILFLNSSLEIHPESNQPESQSSTSNEPNKMDMDQFWHGTRLCQGHERTILRRGLGDTEPRTAVMMGERSAQDKLFGADHIYLDYVGRDTLYGYLAQHRGQLFRDEDFAILYCRNNGRPSVPPSLAVSILFLRAYDSVSFVEAIERTKYDLRWKVALGLERMFTLRAESTFPSNRVNLTGF